MATFRDATVEQLKTEALRLASTGLSQTAIAAQLSELMGEDLDAEERNTKLGLVSESLNNNQEWVARWNTPNTSSAQAGPSSVAAGKRPVAPAEPPANNNNEIHDMVRALMEEVAQLRSAQQTPPNSTNDFRLQALEAENQRLREMAATPAPTPSIVSAPVTNHLKIPDPEMFYGDRKDYRRFKVQMQHKLARDGDRLGSGPGYTFNRLGGTATGIALSWIARYPAGTTEEFWHFLDEQFSDKLHAEKARRKLQMYRQGKTSLQNFNAEFMRLAYDAGEENNVDNLKTRYLSALRSDLQDRMIAVDVPAMWSIRDLMNRVVLIEENLFRAKLGSNFSKAKAPAGDVMDWEPTKAHAGRVGPNPPRKGKGKAKWVSKEERTRRKANNLCMRCGKPGHFMNKCEEEPAERPARAASAAVTETTEVQEEEEETDSEN